MVMYTPLEGGIINVFIFLFLCVCFICFIFSTISTYYFVTRKENSWKIAAVAGREERVYWLPSSFNQCNRWKWQNQVAKSQKLPHGCSWLPSAALGHSVPSCPPALFPLLPQAGSLLPSNRFYKSLQHLCSLCVCLCGTTNPLLPAFHSHFKGCFL